MRGNMKNLFNNNSLSIINPRLHPILDIGCSDMGSHISCIGGEKIIPDSFYKFEKTTIPDEEIMSRLRKEANSLYKKIGNENVGKYSKDNIACIMRYNKGCMSKLYNFIIRRKFMYQTHPNLKRRWVTVFQYNKTMKEERLRNIIHSFFLYEQSL